MAELNPPFALQNAGATHTAAGDRMMLSGLIAGKRITGTTGLISRGGVVAASGGALACTQTGTPSMAVMVASGMVYVPGTEAATQGIYACLNDASKTIAVTTAHGTLPRIDSVVARVYDSQYSGATNTWALEVIAGTAAASPVAPTLPNNSIRLFNINVGAAVTSITNANISDQRVYMSGVGGIIVVATQAERDSLGSVAANGQFAFRNDTGALEVYWGGQWWGKAPSPILSQNQVSAPAYTVNGVWNDFPGVNWPAITFTAPRSGNFSVSIGAQLGTGATHAAWLGYRISGGLTQAANGGLAIGATATSGASYSKEFYFTGATPGASVTVTPQYQFQSGSTGHSIQFGQMRIRMEA